jgi:hypothetical protein
MTCVTCHGTGEIVFAFGREGDCPDCGGRRTCATCYHYVLGCCLMFGGKRNTTDSCQSFKANKEKKDEST